MTHYFFSRRTFNAKLGKFTDNAAALTRYVAIDNFSGGVGKGHLKDQDDWVDAVMAGSGPHGILCFIHGFNNSQTDMLNRMEKIEAGIRQNGFQGAVVGFDWPANGGDFTYFSDRNDAKTVAPYLIVGGLGLFMNRNPRPKLHVLAHSMGAFLTLRGFSGTGDGGSAPWGVDQVAFCAADVDSDWMETGAWGSLVMDRRAKQLTNYYSTLDGVLDLADGIVNGGRARAGRNGLPDDVPVDHHDVYCGEQYRLKVPDSKKSRVHSHRWYMDDAGFLRDLSLTLQGQAAGSMPTRAPVVGSADLALMT